MIQLAKHMWRINMMILVMAAMLAVTPAYAQSTSEPKSVHKDWEAHTHGSGSRETVFHDQYT